MPVVAAEDNGDFVVAWRSFGQDGDNYGIFVRQFDSTGAPKGSELQANSFTVGLQDYQAVASDEDGDFIVVWSSAFQDGGDKGVFARRFSSAGTPLAAEFQVNAYTPSNQHQPAVASDDGGDFVIVSVQLESGRLRERSLRSSLRQHRRHRRDWSFRSTR